MSPKPENNDTGKPESSVPVMVHTIIESVSFLMGKRV